MQCFYYPLLIIVFSGLNHPFSDYCDVCAENKDSVDRDIIGDFCSDTLPVPMSFSCDSLSENSKSL
jgi:hypothetical protein